MVHSLSFRRSAIIRDLTTKLMKNIRLQVRTYAAGMRTMDGAAKMLCTRKAREREKRRERRRKYIKFFSSYFRHQSVRREVVKETEAREKDDEYTYVYTIVGM